MTNLRERAEIFFRDTTGHNDLSEKWALDEIRNIEQALREAYNQGWNEGIEEAVTISVRTITSNKSNHVRAAQEKTASNI